MAKRSRSENDGGPTIGVRHTQCFLIFWGVGLAYAMRVNLSVAIVAMTDRKSANPDFEEYDWPQKTTSLLYSSFFWGYVLTQVLGGYFARKFGGKLSLLAGVSISSVLTILTPLSARIGDWRLVFVVRALEGMIQGFVYPSTHTLLAKWLPKEERATLGTFAYSGGQLGIVFMFAVSGFIASSSLGWPGVFYIPGCLGIVWSVVWYFLSANSPSEHRSISIAEKNMIESSIAEGEQKNYDDESALRKLSTPWMKILTSIPFWALLAAHSSFTWGYWTMLTQIPTFLKNVLGFDIKSNAMLTSLPYLSMFLLNFVFSALAALIDKKKWMNITQSRKFFNTISQWIPAIALVWLGYVDPSQSLLAVILLVGAVGFSAAIHMSFMINHIDLSPNFAGIMLGMTNMVANIMSILAPLTVGAVVKELTNPLQWRIVFFISAGILFIGNLLFIIYGSARKQPWNEPELRVEDELKPIKNETNKV